MIYNLHQYFCNLQKKYSHHSEKNTMETRIIKNIFNKNERCRDVKTQKESKQDRDGISYANHVTLHTYRCIRLLWRHHPFVR